MSNNSPSFFTPEQIQESADRHMEQINLAQEELKQAAAQGQDISEYVWPYGWDYKERPRPHHAKHIISLADAIDLIGARLFSGLWTKEDWYARKLDEIDRWKPENDIGRFGLFGMGDKGANFTQRAEEEKLAYQRKEEIYSVLSSWLSEQLIPAFILDKHGNIKNIPIETWLSDNAISILESGKIRKQEDGKQLYESDFVYLNKNELTKMLEKETKSSKDKILESIVAQKVNCPDGIPIFKAAFLYHYKGKDNDESELIGTIVKNFITFLYNTPELEIFMIESYNGQKSEFNRDLLRSGNIITKFIKGFIPYKSDFHVSEEDGFFIFVNKDQFDRYLNNEPILLKTEDVPSVKDEDETNQLSTREKETYQNIVGALLGLLLGKSSSGKPYSDFNNQQSVIDAIHANYGDRHGLAKRTLEHKFSQSKKTLKSNYPDSE